MAFQNPDSVKVDSCPDSPTYLDYYANHHFLVVFYHDVLPKEMVIPLDSVIEYTWRDIDTNYLDTKTGFQQLEVRFGRFWFIENPYWRYDTNEIYKTQALIYFENYVNIDSVVEFIKEITNVNKGRYIVQYGFYYWVPDDKGMKATDASYIIYPQPAGDKIYLSGLNINNECRLEIFCSTGIIMKTISVQPEETIAVETEELPSGMYFIRIENRIIPFVIYK